MATGWATAYVHVPPLLNLTAMTDTIQVGESYTVSVWLEGAVDEMVNSFEFMLNYDPAVLSATGAMISQDFRTMTGTVGSAAPGTPQIHVDHGDVYFAGYFANGEWMGTDKGMLAYVYFQGIATGTTTVALSNTLLGDNWFSPIHHHVGMTDTMVMVEDMMVDDTEVDLSLDVDNIIVDVNQDNFTTTVRIPSANVSGTGQFVYIKTPVGSIPENTMMSGGRAFKIEARGGITITKWITVTTYFNKNGTMGSGSLNLGSVKLYKYKNGAWMDAAKTCAEPYSEVDETEGKTVTRICSLSQFALFGEAAVDKVSNIYLPIIMK
jgi:hypothetical protein